MRAHPSSPNPFPPTIGYTHQLRALIAEHTRLRDRPAHPWMKEQDDRNMWHNGAIAAYERALSTFEELYGVCET